MFVFCYWYQTPVIYTSSRAYCKRHITSSCNTNNYLLMQLPSNPCKCLPTACFLNKSTLTLNIIRCPNITIFVKKYTVLCPNSYLDNVRETKILCGFIVLFSIDLHMFSFIHDIVKILHRTQSQRIVLPSRSKTFRV